MLHEQVRGRRAGHRINFDCCNGHILPSELEYDRGKRLGGMQCMKYASGTALVQ